MPSRGKSITIWLSETEHDALTALALSQRKAASVYTTSLVRAHLNKPDHEDKPTKDDLFELQKETKEAVKKVHLALCHVSEKLLLKGQEPSFISEDQAHLWVSKYVELKK